MWQLGGGVGGKVGGMDANTWISLVALAMSVIGPVASTVVNLRVMEVRVGRNEVDIAKVEREGRESTQAMRTEINSKIDAIAEAVNATREMVAELKGRRNG